MKYRFISSVYHKPYSKLSIVAEGKTVEDCLNVYYNFRKDVFNEDKETAELNLCYMAQYFDEECIEAIRGSRKNYDKVQGFIEMRGGFADNIDYGNPNNIFFVVDSRIFVMTMNEFRSLYGYMKVRFVDTELEDETNKFIDNFFGEDESENIE